MNHPWVKHEDHIPESIVNFEPWVIGVIIVIMIILAMYFDRRQAQNERGIAEIYNRLNVETDIRP